MSTRFTLIELLVVAAVIAILAALLLPILSRTKYRAKLVVCMNNQKQAVAGATVYASDNSSRYPVRYAIEQEDNKHGFPSRLASRYWGDDRSHINSYIALDDLKCPFSDPAPVMNQVLGVDGLEAVMTSYNFFFGFRWHGETKGMKKLGDILPFRSKEFDIVVGDLNTYYATIRSWNSHPDWGSKTLVFGDWVTNSSRYNFKCWKSDTTHFRGPLDLNFGRRDGSVFRVNSVVVNDQRLTQIPYKYNNDGKSVAHRGSLAPSVEFED